MQFVYAWHIEIVFNSNRKKVYLFRNKTLHYTFVLWFFDLVGKCASWKLKNGSYLLNHNTLIRTLITSFHASCRNWIATSTSTPLTICAADASSWIFASTYLTSLFHFLNLKFWMMPASSGCSLEVAFFCAKMILICKNWPIIDSEWQVRMTFLSSNMSFLLKRAIQLPLLQMSFKI